MVERPFQTFFNSVRSMLNHDNLEGFSRDKIWAEASQTATYMEVSQVKDGMKCSYEKFYSKKPKFWNFMRVFGECSIVNTSSHVKFRNKINNLTLPGSAI